MLCWRSASTARVDQGAERLPLQVTHTQTHEGRTLGLHRRLASMRKLARCDSRILARSASALAASAALRATASAAPGSPPRSACGHSAVQGK